MGAFVLLLGAAIISAFLWLSSGGALQKKVDLYLAVLEESVAGLNINAPVKYNGVDVGKVRSIQLDPKNPERVQLIFAIVRGTPIKVDTVAVLKTQGLTGIAYVELDGGTKDAKPLIATGKQKYPVINTVPSLSTRLETVLSTVLAKLDKTSSNVDSLISAENQSAFKSALADIAIVSKTIAARKNEIDTSLLDMAKTASNTAVASQKLGPLIDDLTPVIAKIEPVIAKLEPVITQLGQTIKSIDKSALAIENAGNAATIASNNAGKTAAIVGDNVTRVADETLPEIQNLLTELNALSVSLRSLVEQTERDPASLLRGRGATPSGPGE